MCSVCNYLVHLDGKNEDHFLIRQIYGIGLFFWHVDGVNASRDFRGASLIDVQRDWKALVSRFKLWPYLEDALLSLLYFLFISFQMIFYILSKKK